MRNCAKLYYGNGPRIRGNALSRSRGLRFKNFVDLDLSIKSNSRKFLKMVDREYELFSYPKIEAYYRDKFKKPIKARVEIFFENEENNILSIGYAGMEREIKRFLFGRFIVLHASCVSYNGFNLFFMGDVKSGKSTTCSAMLDKGARVLGEDYSVLHKSTEEAVLFPTFIGNIRKGSYSATQYKYLKRLYQDRDIPLMERLIDMDKKDYKMLLEYHEKLYRLKNGIPDIELKNNKNVFILLMKDAKQNKNGILIHEKPMKILPELIPNLAANYLQCRDIIKESMDLFLKSECYKLRRAPLDLMISEICSEFGQ